MQAWQEEIIEDEVCSDSWKINSIVPASKEVGKGKRYNKYRLINLI